MTVSGSGPHNGGGDERGEGGHARPIVGPRGTITAGVVAGKHVAGIHRTWVQQFLATARRSLARADRPQGRGCRAPARGEPDASSPGCSTSRPGSATARDLKPSCRICTKALICPQGRFPRPAESAQPPPSRPMIPKSRYRTLLRTPDSPSSWCPPRPAQSMKNGESRTAAAGAAAPGPSERNEDRPRCAQRSFSKPQAPRPLEERGCSRRASWGRRSGRSSTRVGLPNFAAQHIRQGFDVYGRTKDASFISNEFDERPAAHPRRPPRLTWTARSSRSWTRCGGIFSRGSPTRCSPPTGISSSSSGRTSRPSMGRPADRAASQSSSPTAEGPSQKK